MSHNHVEKTCSFCGKTKPVPRSHANRAKNWCCSKECGIAFRKANPSLRSAAISQGIKAKWSGDAKWAAAQRAAKSANKRPEPAVDNATSIPLVRYPYLNALGKRCVTCARMILDRPGKTEDVWFCDDKCRGPYQSAQVQGEKHPRWTERVNVTCHFCEKVTPRAPVFVRDTGHQFCDDACYKGWQRSEEYDRVNPHSPEFWPNAPVIIKQIKRLAAKGYWKAKIAEEMELSIGQLKGFLERERIEVTGKYVYSEGEDNKKFQERVDVACSWCQKIHARAPWLVREGAMFCSNECKYVSRRVLILTLPRDKRWLNARAVARAADEDTCQLCGGYKGSQICVHHIRPLKYYTSATAAHKLSNLVCLCRSCHRKVEGTTNKANRTNWRKHYEKSIKI